MRILLVAPQPFYSVRGTPMSTGCLVRTLCENGHDVDVLTYHDGDDIKVAGLRILRIAKPPGVAKVPVGLSWQKLVADIYLCVALVHLLFQYHYDVIHAVEEAVFPAAVLNVLFRAKLVYDMDSSLADQLTEKWGWLRPLKAALESLENWAFRRADLVVPVCERLADKARAVVSEERIQVLEDAVFEPFGDGGTVKDRYVLEPPTGLLILYTGNLESYQGIDLLLTALSRVGSDVEFQAVVIGGEPGQLQKYERTASTLGISQRIHFLGRRPLRETLEYLCQADIVVSPRIKGENTPMKIYWYLASGKPIVATRIASHTQVLGPESAVFVEPDAESMAAGLTVLLRDGELRRQIGKAGQVLAETKYSIANYKRKVRAGYARLEKVPA